MASKTGEIVYRAPAQFCLSEQAQRSKRRRRPELTSLHKADGISADLNCKQRFGQVLTKQSLQLCLTKHVLDIRPRIADRERSHTRAEQRLTSGCGSSSAHFTGRAIPLTDCRDQMGVLFMDRIRVCECEAFLISKGESPTNPGESSDPTTVHPQACIFHVRHDCNRNIHSINSSMLYAHGLSDAAPMSYCYITVGSYSRQRLACL